jgi:hypothetical protein
MRTIHFLDGGQSVQLPATSATTSSGPDGFGFQRVKHDSRLILNQKIVFEVPKANQIWQELGELDRFHAHLYKNRIRP